jgi:hypothetical protein
MKCRLGLVVIVWLFSGSFSPAQTRTRAHDPEKDKQALVALEQEWLHAKDAVTLDRILALDFVHVVPADHFLTKQEHIDWFLKHPQPKSRKTGLDNLKVRLYGDVAIVNGSVLVTDDSGKEVAPTMFTDVFVYRDGRWQAVNAQENSVRAGH